MLLEGLQFKELDESFARVGVRTTLAALVPLLRRWAGHRGSLGETACGSGQRLNAAAWFVMPVQVRDAEGMTIFVPASGYWTTGMDPVAEAGFDMDPTLTPRRSRKRLSQQVRFSS